MSSLNKSNPIQPYTYNRNTLWLRNTVRQTSRGKSVAARPTAGRPRPLTSLRSTRRPLTSLGMSAWPYRVTTNIPFILYIHIRWLIKHSCTNCALKWETQWFDGELFIHTCMTSPAERADIICQVKSKGRRPDPLFKIPRTSPGPGP